MREYCTLLILLGHGDCSSVKPAYKLVHIVNFDSK